VAREAIQELIFEAQERLLLWEDPALRRLFPLGTGLMALFCGPPGTGKTMAAQVLAAELGLDLYRIDLASVVSKYVGETARNLDRVLTTAARMDVVLFFDEADALFGKRTEIRDAHDRYANTDTNYLLQAIEGYPGIALLASNRKGNIDAAFLRRLRHVVEFHKPDAGLRLQLWDRTLMAIAGEAARDAAIDALPTLAASFELSGAQIKFAVLHALYGARREGGGVGVRHLVGGVERELQKEGRGLARAERERLIALEHRSAGRGMR
jgi:SpoVK/Ycf46/Vps4 family AAA+-type ATPase